MPEIRTPGVRDSVSVLLPAWNEGENLPALAEALLRLPEVAELIVVDDASSDGTETLWQKSAASADPRVTFRRNPVRLGLACSILQALRLATKDLVLVRDSDWNHDLRTFPDLLAAVRDGAALAVASRYARGTGRVGRVNDLLSITLNRLLSRGGQGISDWTYGYFLARRELLEGAPLGWIFRGRGEYSVRFYRWLREHSPHQRITCVPTVVQARGGGSSSTRPFRHGLAYLAAILEPMPKKQAEKSELSGALATWARKGKGVEACGHSGPGLRSRLALVSKEKENLKGPALDLGCGNGAFTRLALGNKEMAMDGADLSHDLLAEAHVIYRKTAVADLREGVPASLRAERYATVLCLELAQYLSWSELLRLLKEAKEQSEPSANLLFLFPHRESLWHRVRRMLGLGAEDYLCSHDASLAVAAALEAGWAPQGGWACSYGSEAPDEIRGPKDLSPAHAHVLLRFQA